MTNNIKCNMLEPDTDFSQSVFYKISQLSIYIEKLAQNFFEIRNVDISHDEFSALNLILNHPNICQRDLAKLILRDRVRTGRILNSLEDKGYVKRTNTTKNNRLVRLVSITKAGEKFYKEQFYIMNKVMEKLLEEMSFTAGSDESVETLEINVDFVNERLKDLSENEDLSRYVL